MEPKVKGKFVTSSKVKFFQNSFCKKTGNNYHKKYFLAILMHYRFMGHQSYVLLCSKITRFHPSEGEFSEKLGIFSKVKNFQNPFCKKNWK